MYDYKCEYCEGTVRPKKVKREAFKNIRPALQFSKTSSSASAIYAALDTTPPIYFMP